MPPTKLGCVTKTPATLGGDGLVALSEDLMRIVVNANGGFPNHPDFAREIVRQLREMYSELERPTERKAKGVARTVDEDDEEEGYGR